MKSQARYLVVVCLMALGFVTGVRGQATAAKSSSARTNVTATRKKPSISPEEKVVRAAYEKLTMLNSATLRSAGDSVGISSEDDVLRFELSNFQVGPIQEILGALHNEIKTGGAGENILISRSVTRF